MFYKMSKLMYQRLSEVLGKNPDGTKETVEDYINKFFGLRDHIEKVIIDL